MLDEGKFLSEMLVGPDHDVPWLMWIVAALCWPVWLLCRARDNWLRSDLVLVSGLCGGAGAGPGLCHGEEIGDTTPSTRGHRQDQRVSQHQCSVQPQGSKH